MNVDTIHGICLILTNQCDNTRRGVVLVFIIEINPHYRNFPAHLSRCSKNNRNVNTKSSILCIILFVLIITML